MRSKRSSAMEIARGKPGGAMHGSFKNSFSERLAAGHPEGMRPGKRKLMGSQALASGKAQGVRSGGDTAKSIALGHAAGKTGHSLVHQLDHGKALGTHSRASEKALSSGRPRLATGGHAKKDKPARNDCMDRLKKTIERNETLGRHSFKSGGHLWIAKATANKGALHKELHVPQGQKIPASKLEKAEHSRNPLTRKRARLAETLKGFHH